MTRLPFLSHFSPVNKVLDTIHLDLVGPISAPSTKGTKYFLTITDQFSSFKTVKFLKNKSNTFSTLKEFINKAKTQLNTSLKRIISDNGTKFTNSILSSFCKDKGIIQNFSPPYTPQNNGISERTN